MRCYLWLVPLPLLGILLVTDRTAAADRPDIQVHETADYIQIDTDALQARIRMKGYVSGVEKGTFLDKKTGAREQGFGLHIMDFLLAPGWADDGYARDLQVHGHLPKHYIEGPQICTQAKQLQAEVVRGPDHVTVRLRFRFTQPAKGLKAGSTWVQTLVFRPGQRYFQSNERITSVNDVDDLFYRIDMPGHVRHHRDDTFHQVYLSYHGTIPATAFDKDFAPDAQFLYQRQARKIPGRMIRAYQVKSNGKPGPWLAGMTLDPAEVSEAWCHERGYICFIQELHQKKVKAGETFGADYVVGFFDDVAEMEKVYDRYRGSRVLAPKTLDNTNALPDGGDLAAKMVAGIDQYLLRALAASPERRRTLWKPDSRSPETFARSLQPHRERLAKILGVVDKQLPVPDLEYIANTTTPSLVAEGQDYTVHAVRWPVLDGVDAEGLLLEPRGKPTACVVALPDADWSPEMLVGLAPGVPAEAQFARRLAENGCRVLVPTLIDRQDTWSGNPTFRMTNQPHREFVYRMAFEMGRHVIGYEVQKVLAAVDWFTRAQDHPLVGVIGYGEGGLLALYSGALDPRIRATVVSGYFGPREDVWKEPIYRNVWGLLHEFGDAEMARLFPPRRLIVEASRGPEVAGPPPARLGRAGAAPGQLGSPSPEAVAAEVRRIQQYDLPPLGKGSSFSLLASDLPGNEETLRNFLLSLGQREKMKPSSTVPVDARKHYDPAPRLRRQLEQLVAFTQRLLRAAESHRQEFFWSKTAIASIPQWEKSTQKLRAYFWEEVIGKLPAPEAPVNPRTRLAYDEPKWTGYEVTLDLYPDVFAYGILLLPKDLKPGERRPVVVCQHGLEGRSQDVVNPRTDTPYYHSFGARLADRGYVVFAPQNPYIGWDHFRVLQRKANPLKLSLFSFIVRQHERILDWLASQPFVDADRIGFYGLSYGGKTALRVPAILPRYALSICSGDFNEWIVKNVSVDYGGTYMLTFEYEMVEFDLGNTFNHAEMAGLIAPRPFMVERGHDDGVGTDEWISYEYARVRRLFTKLGIPDRTAIEYFNSGHEIHARGTFEFLDRHLRDKRN